MLVFAELLGAFGARSVTKPLWRIAPFLNRHLLAVVAFSFGLQVWSQHNATFGRFVKTPPVSFADCFMLLALGAIPLVAPEAVKVVRHALGRAFAGRTTPHVDSA